MTRNTNIIIIHIVHPSKKVDSHSVKIIGTSCAEEHLNKGSSQIKTRLQCQVVNSCTGVDTSASLIGSIKVLTSDIQTVSSSLSRNKLFVCLVFVFNHSQQKIS